MLSFFTLSTPFFYFFIPSIFYLIFLSPVWTDGPAWSFLIQISKQLINFPISCDLIESFIFPTTSSYFSFFEAASVIIFSAFSNYLARISFYLFFIPTFPFFSKVRKDCFDLVKKAVVLSRDWPFYLCWWEAATDFMLDDLFPSEDDAFFCSGFSVFYLYDFISIL